MPLQAQGMMGLNSSGKSARLIGNVQTLFTLADL